ncbi:protein of unknown function [uncultured Woeseiaceae bacterium]|uniref:Uncharacterized protein n=1 Tax=uncultured Woeseiaceae bacterium TaxID=1983305 RepID=A0A7D9D336_9GAMM|nr:protein of unknown function [uncultured Woeseiaceae bacterium]
MPCGGQGRTNLHEADLERDKSAGQPIWTHERSEWARRASCRDAASQPTRTE